MSGRVYIEKDITDQKFGSLTALKRDMQRKGRLVYWLFLCDCGKIASMQKTHILSGRTKSCGCKGSKVKLQLAGMKLGNLTVIEYSHTDSAYRTYWKCLCDCGKICIVRGSSMYSSTTKSCGCLTQKYKRRNENINTDKLGLRKLYASYRGNARAKKRKFDLTLDEFRDITSQNCTYCGSEPSTISCAESSYMKDKYSMYRYNGIDRVDSKRGYEKDNIVPCCKLCNLMKLNNNMDTFIEHISKIYKHISNLNKVKYA